MSKRVFVCSLVCLLVLLSGTVVLAQGDLINVGDVIQGTVANSTAEYRFDAKAGETLTISLESEDFDTYLEVQDSNGNLVGYDDDGGDGLNSQLLFSPPETGTYTIVVRGFSGNATGSYTLSLSAIQIVSVTYGTTTPLTIAAGDVPFQFTIDGQAGDVLNIYTDNRSVDVRMSLFDPEGAEIYYDDDGGVGVASYLRRVRLPAAGTYRLTVEPFSDSTEGTTNLVVEQTSLEMLSATPVSVLLNEDLSLERFGLEAAGGTLYRMTVQADTAATGSLDVELGLFQAISVSFTDVLEASFVFEIPEDGLYSVKLTSYTWMSDSVNYQVTVTPVG